MRTTEVAVIELIHRANKCKFISQNCAEYIKTETSEGMISPKDKLATPIFLLIMGEFSPLEGTETL